MDQQNIVLKQSDFPDYELLDSGNGHKLERFGKYILNRIETQAIWKPTQGEQLWHSADAVYERKDEKQSYWKKRGNIPDSWNISYNNFTFNLKLTSFGHVGIFPEQAPQWDWIEETVKQIPESTVLSLFSYTGAATFAAAAAGARVTHVDASKPSITWARENQALSRLNDKPIRWIAEDALKFVKRELRRGNKYSMIIMDPPKFGRGPQGEVWKFEESILELLEFTRQLLAPSGKILLTAYAVPISPITLKNTVQSYYKNKQDLEFGEILIEESKSGRLLPTAIYVRG